MGLRARWEYLRKIFDRYRSASKRTKQSILTEFCAVTEYNRKYAIQLLNGPRPEARPPKRKRHPRRPTYGSQAVSVLKAIWEAANYPWSVRLKAMLPHWLPWAQKRYRFGPTVERQLLSISARQIDRRLAPYRCEIRKRLYGRTKPGTLLKHQIPIKTSSWDVAVPGYAEIDLVAHCGDNGHGEFIHSLTLTDIHTTWTEMDGVMGKSQARVEEALDGIRTALPFRLLGLDADNGAEFINHHLLRYTEAHGIQFTRGRPYKKDDNAHVEQKNWTNVRKLLGYERYDSGEALKAIRHLYRNELRLFQNLFLPSVKLVRKQRVGSRLHRRYDAPRTPIERLIASGQADPKKLAALCAQRTSIDPFALSSSIERQLARIYSLANRRRSPSWRGAVEAAGPDAAVGAARPPAAWKSLRDSHRSLDAASKTNTWEPHPQLPQPSSSNIKNKRTNANTPPPTCLPARQAPCRAKPVDGSSKRKRRTPPTGLRRRKQNGARSKGCTLRVRFLAARRSRSRLDS